MQEDSDPLDRPAYSSPEMIWGTAFTDAGPRDLSNCDDSEAEGFRWLHFSLADHRTRRWIEDNADLPPDVRDLLLSPDTHQRAVAQDGCVGCVIHDFVRDFEHAQTERIGAIHIALTPRLVITTRLHPVRSADIVRTRIAAGALLESPGAALDLMVNAITVNISEIARALEQDAQAAEDAFLEGRGAPESRELITIRRRLAQIHRMLDGMRGVFHRLEHDSDVPRELRPIAENLSQRLHALDGDIMSVQGQLRTLREEIDAQQEQRTNQNLYLLSIITALMLPTTLVTGLFGMNTGDLPLTGHGGTGTAILLMLAGAAGTYWLLRWMGFMRR